MLIGIDASRAAQPRRTGTENYALHLIQALLAAGGDYTYRLYCNQPPAVELFSAGSRAEVLPLPAPRLWTHIRLAAEVARRPPAVLFVPAHVVPLFCRPPAVVTIHDLGYLVYPQAHTTRSRLYLDLSTRLSARRAKRIVVPSAFTRADLVARLGVPADKITVVAEAAGPSFAPPSDTAKAAAVAARYGLRQPYFVALGTMQPRKNLARLLAAFSLARAAARLPHQLALIGQFGLHADALTAAIHRHGLEDAVVLTGYVPETDLPALLGASEALAFPSLFEGFGLPVLEAMACGVPVLAANATSLPEVTGDAALLVDPTDEPAMAEALGQMLGDSRLRAELSRRGLMRARLFTWQRAAAETLDVLVGAALA